MGVGGWGCPKAMRRQQIGMDVLALWNNVGILYLFYYLFYDICQDSESHE